MATTEGLPLQCKYLSNVVWPVRGVENNTQCRTMEAKSPREELWLREWYSNTIRLLQWMTADRMLRIFQLLVMENSLGDKTCPPLKFYFMICPFMAEAIRQEQLVELLQGVCSVPDSL